jgi:protein-disulfide isomerase
MPSPNNSNNANPWKLSSFLMIGLIVGYSFAQLGPNTAEIDFLGGSNLGQFGDVETVEVTPTEVDAPELEVVEVSADDDTILGDADAPIEIVEFSDFQCPFCQRFYLNTLPQLKENYIDTGLVKLVYRDYPLSIHPNADNAAIATECSGEQDDYWGMHDLVFDNMSQWSSSSDANAIFITYADDLDLNVDEFTSCLDDEAIAAEVNADFSDGLQYGVTATPTFFVNGQKLVGAQSYTVFSGILDSLLEE